MLEVVPAADLRRVHDHLAAFDFALARVLPPSAERGIRRLRICVRGSVAAVAGGDLENEKREAQGRQACRSHGHRPGWAGKNRRQCSGVPAWTRSVFAVFIRAMPMLAPPAPRLPSDLWASTAAAGKWYRRQIPRSCSE